MRATKEAGKILDEYVKLAKKLGKFPTAHEVQQIIASERQIKNHFGSFSKLKALATKNFPELGKYPDLKKDVKILVFDIETMFMTLEGWGLRDQNFSPDQIIEDSCMIGWAAKWLNEPASKVIYMDQSKAKNIFNNKKIVNGIIKLLNEADIVVSQNGIRFDTKKINTEVEFWNMETPSNYRHHDLLKIAKKYLNLPSYKLEYMSNRFNKKYKKLKHKKYPGQELWRECKRKNKDAWVEMRKYNIHDVLATEELYNRFKKWFFRKYS